MTCVGVEKANNVQQRDDFFVGYYNHYTSLRQISHTQLKVTVHNAALPDYLGFGLLAVWTGC